MAETGDSSMTPAQAIRAIGKTTKIVVPVSVLIALVLMIGAYLRDAGLERLNRVETTAAENRARIADHESRLIRTETQADATRESLHRIEAALIEQSSKLDRIAERTH